MAAAPNAEAVHRYHTAKGYFQSAIMIARSPERNDVRREMLSLLSMCMLTAFALELYFKAYLLACGRPSGKVRSYRHRIGELYRDARAAGLKDAVHDGQALATFLDGLVPILSPGHEDYTFRYIEEGAQVMVPLDWEQTFSVLNALDDVVDEKVGASAAYGLATGRMNR